ncbi:MAG TPA: thioredoxin domain-containing protein [Sphingomicrobium sp.]|nr:thioredoxin domain-containing protein [Sphingomicrobium sp.]
MKASYLILATAVALASGACNAQKSGDGAATTSTEAETVKPPADGDWSTVVTKTSQGGFRMGNPNAKVRLVELGSLTCPHCREFDVTGLKPLVENYVKSGQVSYEFRNYVRDPYDIAASLIARCNGADSFFALTNAIFEDQPTWIAKLQEVPQEQLTAITNAGDGKQFLEIAKLAGLQQWAAMRGVPTAKSTACLTDQEAVNQLVQMNSDAVSQFPDMPGTPTFIINGEMVEAAGTWATLEPKIREALGG